MSVKIVFDVEVCRDDCPFCGWSEVVQKYYCTRLMAAPQFEGAGKGALIEDRYTKPLPRCPFRSEDK